MRILYCFNIILILSFFSCSRSNEIKSTVELFNHYQKEDGYVIFKVSSKMIELFLDNEKDRELLNNLKKIKHIRVMLFINSMKNKEKIDNQLNTIVSYYTKWNYKNYFDFNDTINNVIVKYSESLPDKYSEMIVFLKDEQGFLVMSFMDKSSENHLIPLLKPENLERIKAMRGKNPILSF